MQDGTVMTNWYLDEDLMLLLSLLRSLNALYPDNVFGFLVNIPSAVPLVPLSLPFRGNHWFAVRKIGDSYYDLDSKLNEPRLIGVNVLQYLTDVFSREPSAELLLVVNENIAETRSWELTAD